MSQTSRRSTLQALASMPALGVDLMAQIHRAMRQQSTGKASGNAARSFLNSHQFKTIGVLCNSIIPADEKSGGAVEAGVPDLIDLLASENEDYQTRLSGGLLWLDSTCHDQYGEDYIDCSPSQQKQVLDVIAYRKNAGRSPKISPGVAFFAFLRDLTLGGHFASEIGMKGLPYLGNQVVSVFPGCPPTAES